MNSSMEEYIPASLVLASATLLIPIVSFIASHFIKCVVYGVLFELLWTHYISPIHLNINLTFKFMIQCIILFITTFVLYNLMHVFLKVLLLFVVAKAVQFARTLSTQLLYHPDTVTPEQRMHLQNSSLRYEPVTFMSSDGESELSGIYVHGRNFAQTQPLLFCHGNAGNIYHRIPNLMALNQAIGCDIFIFDYRCFGDSTNISINQKGIIDDTVSAFAELKKRFELKKQRMGIHDNNQVKPIVFGRSLGGAIAIHSVCKLINARDGNACPAIGGLVIENTFTSVFEAASYIFLQCNWLKWLLYPLICDKWNSVDCIAQMNGDEAWQHIPKLFLSGAKDELLDPVMMRELAKEATKGSKWVMVERFNNGGHNDTWTCEMYFEHVRNFVRSCSML
eukprot:927999_1